MINARSPAANPITFVSGKAGPVTDDSSAASGRYGYARRLGLFSGTMMVMGGIIGSGIFRSPQVVAQRVQTPGLTLLVWLIGGVIALIGAFIYAELGGRSPRAGGQYVYLRDTFGPLPAFLYAWALLLIIATGAIAAVAVTFADYALALLGTENGPRTLLASGAIVLLSAINYAGVKPGAVTQNIFTVLKLAALGALIAAGLAAAAGLIDMPALVAEPVARPANVLLAIGAALVPVLFSIGGWQQTNFIAEEIIEPERNLPRALIIGVVGVVIVYLLANYTYLATLGAAGLAASDAPAADSMTRLVGNGGRTLITAGIVVSTFGFLNLVILVTPRVIQAMAADGLFIPRLARLHPRYRTPGAAIVLQGIWALILVQSGRYGALLDYVVFADWIFFGMTAASLFVYRARDRSDPGRYEGFRMPGHPVLPALFIAAALYVVIGSVSSNPGNAARGAALLALGIPVFFWSRRRAAAGGH
jgi:APA family basic amino acid/polyamine antiporter